MCKAACGAGSKGMAEQAAENVFPHRSVTSAAKAGAKNRPLIAAVNRCATQKQMQERVFPQGLKRYPDMKPSFFSKL
jgi:hypothetical protein